MRQNTGRHLNPRYQIGLRVQEVAFGLLAVVALYLGAGGWASIETEEALQDKLTTTKAGEETGSVVYRGVTFSSAREARAAIETETVDTWFPWLLTAPPSVSLMIVSIAFGFLGGVARTVKLISLDQKEFSDTKSWMNCLFGAFIGLLLLGISVVIPAALASGTKTVRPASLLFLCLFGGLFAEQFYTWLEGQVTRLLARKRQPKKGD